MPKLALPLTTIQIKNAKPSGKPLTLFDGMETGLHVLVQPNSTKTFRLKIQIDGKDRRLTIGTFPDMTLAEAREEASKLKKQIKQGIDPTAPVIINTFAAIAEKFVEWKATEHQREPATVRKYNECLRNDLLPSLGNKDIKDVHTRDVVSLLESINKRSNSLAVKNQKLVSMIIKFAIQRGYREPYTNLDLAGLIKQKKPAIKRTPANIPAIFKKIDDYPESVMRYAMQLQFLTFLRASETMGAEWSEFNLKKKEWHIPAHRMKMNRPHVIPLARQTVALLKDLKKFIGEGGIYLFPSTESKAGHLVRDSLSKAFREAELDVTPHECRTVASTWLRNAGFAPHLTETQLSHAESNAVAAAYQSEPHLLYLNERHPMMQVWADCLIPVDDV